MSCEPRRAAHGPCAWRQAHEAARLDPSVAAGPPHIGLSPCALGLGPCYLWNLLLVWNLLPQKVAAQSMHSVRVTVHVCISIDPGAAQQNLSAAALQHMG
jgi:hypothetical protein